MKRECISILELLCLNVVFFVDSFCLLRACGFWWLVAFAGFCWFLLTFVASVGFLWLVLASGFCWLLVVSVDFWWLRSAFGGLCRPLASVGFGLSWLWLAWALTPLHGT